MNSLNQALEEVKRREDLADNILVNLIKLEKSIDILQTAIKLLPKGVSSEEMIIVKQRLDSALQSKGRATITLEDLGVNIELRRKKVLEHMKKND